MINFSCPKCGRHFSVPDYVAGQKGKCKACGCAIVAPKPGSAPSERIVSKPKVESSTAAPTNAQPTAQRANVPNVTSPAPSVSAGGAAAVSQPKKKLPMRIRRLVADVEQVRLAFGNFPLIKIRGVAGNPPELYQVEYHVRGLVRGPDGKPVYHDHHLVEIQLTREYPRQSPKCRMLTPVFHPNIEPAAICVGDHWTAGERLVDLIIRIGEIITYQAYNIQSPLDGEAAMWTDQNRDHLPTDSRNLRPPSLD